MYAYVYGRKFKISNKKRGNPNNELVQNLQNAKYLYENYHFYHIRKSKYKDF